MPNVMAHPAIGDELALETAFFARFEEEEEAEWGENADRAEGWRLPLVVSGAQAGARSPVRSLACPYEVMVPT